MVELLSAPGKLVGQVSLPGSKSSSNRWLILNAISGNSGSLSYLSEADDTQLLFKALNEKGSERFVGAAGTAMRFLTAFLATQPGEFKITGSDRAHHRPISQLVDALRLLGADISYLGKEGFPPLEIRGKALAGGSLRMDATVSSQYISALLLIAPILKNKLVIHWEGKLVSMPYLQQTVDTLQAAGIEVEVENARITVSPGMPKIGSRDIEADWSSAGYWAAMVCLKPNSALFLDRLDEQSNQADKVVLELLRPMGLQWQQKEDGLHIRSAKTDSTHNSLEADFSDCPDLAPTLICFCAAARMRGVFTGISTLKYKESDRLLSLKEELHKFGHKLSFSDDYAELIPTLAPYPSTAVVCSAWSDHRIVMSMNLLVCAGAKISWETPAVVSKSYPRYWDDLSKLGFEMKY